MAWLMATNQYVADKFSIDPFEAYRHAFGYRALPFPQEVALSKLIPNPLKRLSKLGAAILKRHPDGTEAFCPVTITYKGTKYDLPYSTVAMTLRKDVVKTPLVGRKGKVKELVSIDDYEFTIQGIILGEDLPEDELMKMNELFNINESVKLENAFTEIFLQKDNSVVIEQLDLPDMKGVIGAQAYTIRCTQDTILEIEEV